MKKLWDRLTSMVVLVLVLATVLLVAARASGLQVFTVLSGSMEPSYHVGALIFVRPVDSDGILPGQPVTFSPDGGIPVTHRVVEVLTGDDGAVQYRTKGDANDTPDAKLVKARWVIGVPIFTVPYLGYAISWMQSLPGRWTLLGIGAVLVLVPLLTGQHRCKGGQKKTAPQAEGCSADNPY